MITWCCVCCGSTGALIPRAFPRARVCAWCLEDLISHDRYWCRRCNQSVPAERAASRSKDRAISYCKDCHSAAQTARYWRDPALHRERRKASYRKHPETSKAYTARHRTRYTAYARAWRARNPERQRASKRAWRERNPERMRAYEQRRQRDPVRRREQDRRRRAQRLLKLLRGEE